MSERVFYGMKGTQRNPVWFIQDGQRFDLPTSPRPGRTIPGGRNWGYGGTGPRQLAWDLAVALFGRGPCAAAAAGELLQEFVAKIEGTSWEASELVLRQICAAAVLDLSAPPPEIEGGMKLDE